MRPYFEKMADLGNPLKAADLTQRWTFRGGPTRQDIFRTFSTGLNGTPMPSFFDSVSEPDRWALTNTVQVSSVTAVRKAVEELYARTWPGGPLDRLGSAFTDMERLFNGQFPGPVVRVTEGDTVKFKLTNPASNKHPHAMDFHAAEIDFLENYRAINAGESIEYTFVAKKPGIFFYHCGAPPMIQHVARGMFGAIIVDPKNAKAWAKADREYVLVQSEFFKNPDDVQAMFDRKFDNVIFNGGIFKYHPFSPGGSRLVTSLGSRASRYTFSGITYGAR